MRQSWLRTIGAVFLGGICSATIVRSHVFFDDLTLWTDAARKAPTKMRPVLNEGRAHELRGDPVFAEAAYRKVIWLSWNELRSPYARRFAQAAAETNLAHLAMKEGRFASAMRILDGTLSQWPEFAYAHYNKGSILHAIGECEAAAVEYQAALQGDPSLPRPGACEPSSSTPQ